jgi:hypothetical protein
MGAIGRARGTVDRPMTSDVILSELSSGFGAPIAES